MSRTSSPSAASRSPMKRFASGVARSGAPTPDGLRRRRGRLGDTWHLDELFVSINGRRQYLWRAVDEDGDVLDILVQSRRNRRAAGRFFRKLLKKQGRLPRRLITDKLRSYPAAHRSVMPSVVHCTDQYANNRAEVSHQPTRQRERQIENGGVKTRPQRGGVTRPEGGGKPDRSRGPPSIPRVFCGTQEGCIEWNSMRRCGAACMWRD